MPPSAELIWQLNQQELLNLLNLGALTQKKQIRFYAPSFTYYKNSPFLSSPNVFPTISVTGNSCALNCKHCGGKVLATMQPAVTPEKLFELCSKLKRDGAVGCLISGGCLPDGSVPLKPFAGAIARVKRELGLTVFVHTGIVDLDTAVFLKQSGVNAALIDILGSQETIEKVYGLKVTVQNYVDSLFALQNSGLPFVPHLIVGLKDGKLEGEFAALQMISKVNPSAVVIIAFMPLHGTEMANVEPPQPHDIARVTASARVMFPQTPLALGCMRPKGKHRATTDVLALKAGVDAVAFPSQGAIDFVKRQGWTVLFSPYCCAQVFVDSAKG
ncbi:MAG: radical SAM protein [Candidatus Bathyarchaeia archaeon]|jgi:uncharacterized radical SAM superfamily protein